MNKQTELRSAGHVSIEHRPGQESYAFHHQDNLAELERCEAVGNLNSLYRFLERRSGGIVRTDLTLKKIGEWLNDMAPK